MTTTTPFAPADAYLSDLFVGADSALDAALAESAKAGLPEIQVSPPQGKMLHILARLQSAHDILEIGTLGGYSAIWLARALPPGGRLVTIENEPKHADVARANIQRAGLADRVDLRVGRALDVLPQIQSEGLGPFDFVFIDADKVSNPDYFQWALRLGRPGTLIIVDNVVREGGVLDASSVDPSIVGTRRVLEMMASEPRVSATAIQVVGTKGWDGIAMAVITKGA